ncbi:MAG: hypothetical protein ACI9NT_001510 [Bacteroidia bacterium]|jgi:hypothetical protein
MEKLMYSLWKDPALTADDFRDQLLQELVPTLNAASGIHGLRLCVADSAVADAVGRRMESHAPVPEGMLSLWVHDAGGAQQWEPLVAKHVDRFAAYLVAEAEPLIASQVHPSVSGERQFGMCHVVFMSHPAAMDQEAWFKVWKGSHTQVAIDTQSTFGYRQNVVVRAITEGAQHSHAIVEENFPPEAMTSDHAFYNTGGDEAVLKKHMTAMMESCGRFIDFEHIDVIPMSEYLIRPVATP